MRTLVFAFALIAVVVARPQWFELENYTFEKYVKEYSKQYSEAEFQLRKEIFQLRLDDIMKHNQDSTKTWKRGINHMSDWTDEEFQRLLGYKKSITRTSTTRQEHIKTFEEVDINSLPQSKDWRQSGVITAVKDQGECGSCWSFGSAETVESYWALATGQLMDLSEQQILDCTPNPNDCGGTGGCGGGTPELAYQQMITLGGLSTEWVYPYVSYPGQNFNCHFNTTPQPPLAQVTGYVVLPSNQYDPVMKALATVGPLAINVDASQWSDYESGVYNGCSYTNIDIDHVVQLVGYGTDPQGGDYWLVRNSWNTGWGENGYIRLSRQSNAQCGPDKEPTDGTGCKGGPSVVTVCGSCGILYDVSYPEVKPRH